LADDRRHYMMLYINDFLSDDKVQALDDEQFAWYMRMLMRAWGSSNPCKLVNTEEDLMDAAGCKDETKWKAKSRKVLRIWEVVDDGKFITQKRLQDEHRKVIERSEAGRANAKMRWQCDGNAMAMPNDATHYPLPITQTQTEPKTKPSAVALPEWIPVDSWDGFVEMRKRLRKPLTTKATELILAKLDNLRSLGHPPKAVLEQSIERGWQSVFELKQEQQSFNSKPQAKMKSVTEIQQERDAGR
jgi:uncharacterized protein YdaU (DUF1376 family)